MTDESDALSIANWRRVSVLLDNLRRLVDVLARADGTGRDPQLGAELGQFERRMAAELNRVTLMLLEQRAAKRAIPSVVMRELASVAQEQHP